MRAAILHEAVSLATVEGLEGLSIGTLATALNMSKSGLYAHFGSKQELQLATVEEAGRVFEAEVIEPALAAPPGVAQLVAVCDAFFEHLERRRFPGGCFFAGAALVRQFVLTAQELGQLADDEDPDQLTFELNGIILAANTNFVLHQDPHALDLARQVVRRRLGVKKGSRAAGPVRSKRSPRR